MAVAGSNPLVGVLGPVAVAVDGGLEVVRGTTRAAVLAGLVLRRGRWIDPDALIELAWPDDRGDRRNALQAHVSRLRRQIGAHRIEHGSAGYRLVLDDDELDTGVFGMTVAQAEADAARGDVLAAVDGFTDALARWRGRPYEGLEDRPDLRIAAADLEHRRFHADLRLQGLRLEAGQAERSLAPLEALYRDHPLDERVLRLLATCRYRCGRSVEALEAINRFGKDLAELGLEVNEDVRELELAILLEDPALRDETSRLPVNSDVGGREGLRPLDPRAVEVLEAVTVAGDEATADVVEGLLHDGTRELLDALAGSGLLRADGTPILRYRFVDETVRDEVLQAIGPARRSALHAEVAALVEALHGLARLEECLAVADHLSRTGSLGALRRSADLCVRAGRLASERFAHRDAIEYIRRALRTLEELDELDDERRAELLVLIGRIGCRIDQQTGRCLLTEAADDARRSGRRFAFADAVLSMRSGFPDTGQVDESLAGLLREALALHPEPNSAVRAELLATLCMTLTYGHVDAERVELAREARDVAERADDRRTLVRVAVRTGGIDYGDLGLAARRDRCRELRDLSAHAEDDEQRFELATVRFYVAMHAGEVAEARVAVGEQAQIAASTRDARFRWLADYRRAHLHLLAGELDEAEAASLAMVEPATEASDPSIVLNHAGQLAVIRRDQGRVPELAGVVDGLAADPGSEVPVVSAGLALLLAELGDRDGARVALRAAIDRARRQPVGLIGDLAAMGLMAEVLVVLDDPEHADALAALLDQIDSVLLSSGAFTPCGWSHARGIAADLLDDPAAERHLRDAVRVHDDIGAPLLAARSRVVLARHLERHRGPGPESRALRARAADDAECRGAAARDLA